MSRHNGLPHRLSNITLPPTLLQPLGSKGEEGATEVPLLLHEQQLGGETQINATFPELSKETSTLQQLLYNLKATLPRGLCGQRSQKPVLVCFWFDTAFWVISPIPAAGGASVQEHALKMHTSCCQPALFQISRCKMDQGDRKIWLHHFSSPCIEVRAPGQEDSLKGPATNAWERCPKLHVMKLGQHSSCTGVWQGHWSKQVCLI